MLEENVKLIGDSGKDPFANLARGFRRLSEIATHSAVSEVAALINENDMIRDNAELSVIEQVGLIAHNNINIMMIVAKLEEENARLKEQLDELETKEPCKDV